MSLETPSEYNRRLHRVLNYIDAHLDESIDLARLARVAHYSAFHFHRVFAARVGETLGAYLTRRRVETAAARMAAQPRLTVISAALSVGFGSPEAFARAFRRRFGRTPTQWRHSPERRVGEKSKMGQEIRSLDQDKPARRRYARGMKTKARPPLSVTVLKRPPVRFAYLRYQGPFGPPVGRFWGEEVYPWMVANDLLGAPRYGVSRDDPQVTDRRKCRYDAGAQVAPDYVPSQKAQVADLPGGLYACTRFRGTSEDVPRAWDRILGEWLPDSGYQLDARPSFEYYPVDGEMDPKTGVFSCDLCLPIAPLRG
jgi:AraC family transcriptional regulator